MFDSPRSWVSIGASPERLDDSRARALLEPGLVDDEAPDRVVLVVV